MSSTSDASLPVITLGTGADSIALNISEQAYQGDANFVISVDGQQIGGVQSTTASHSAGQDQQFVVQGNFGPGPHVLAVNFLNDAYGGTPQLDRNLFIDSITAGGRTDQTMSALFFPGPVYYEVVLPCFCPGTAILTAAGEVPVETLAIGDTVVTATGQHRVVRWIGRRSYAGRFLAANPQAQPVRFRAGSLGNGLPRRDLLVSPEHAMFLDGVLVPARQLVNGTTIMQERGHTAVDYFHVELDSHDVILAEGAATESFVDDASRGMFQNAAEWEQLYPGRTRVPAVFCAPRVDSGPALDAVRRRLDEVMGAVAQAA